MNIVSMGWDLGGAHVKAAAYCGDGQAMQVEQEACPLWLGLDRLDAALTHIKARFNPPPECRHAVTMTGELADCFKSRKDGVNALVAAMQRHLAPQQPRFFDGSAGLQAVASDGLYDWEHVASANWKATGVWVSACLPNALLVDVGSTTTDVIVIRQGEVDTRGYTDPERLRYDELVYTGVVRTPLMAMTSRALLAGEWVPVMAEHFATLADVYRLTGELSESHDQAPTADGGEKTPLESARRLARALGHELEAASLDAWSMTARLLRDQHLTILQRAIERQLSFSLLTRGTPLVGAGIGRFLVRDCATRLNHPYRDINELFPSCITTSTFSAADCAPAAALACLAGRGWVSTYVPD